MDVMLSAQEYSKLRNERKQALERNDELVKELRTQEERNQILLKEFTKVKEESMELKMQIKDISKQALKVNRYHLVREDQIKGEIRQKQKGFVDAQKEQRERAAKLEEEVLSLKQELERKEQKEKDLAVVQKEKVPQL